MQYGHSRKGNNMIKINHLTITQNKDLRDLVSDLNINIQDGEKVAIIGEEGNGKSTLLKTLMGEALPDFTIKGDIQSDLQSIAYIPQHLPEELKKRSLQDYFFLDPADLDYSILYRFAEELHFDSDRFASDQEIGSLSGGEALKIQLIHKLAKPFEVLFLDEPTSGLDPTTSKKIHKLLQELKERGTTIFLTTHDMNEATLLCDNLALLNKGDLIEQGSPSEIIQKYNTEKKVAVTYSDSTKKVVRFEDLQQEDYKKMMTIHSCEPTLEDIFIKLTGEKLDV